MQGTNTPSTARLEADSEESNPHAGKPVHDIESLVAAVQQMLREKSWVTASKELKVSTTTL